MKPTTPNPDRPEPGRDSMLRRRVAALASMRILRLTIAQRLAAGFGVLLVLMTAISILDLTVSSRVGDQLQQVVEVNNPKIDLGYRMLDSISQLGLQARTITLLIDPRQLDAEVRTLEAARTAYQQDEARFVELARAGGSAEEGRLIAAIAESSRKTVPLILRSAKEGGEGGNTEATNTLMLDVRPREAVWRQRLLELIRLEEAESHAAYLRARSTHSQGGTLALGVLLASMLLGAGLGIAITASVKRPIEHAIGVAESIADGRLTSAIDASGRDEVARLLAAMAAMQGRLCGIVAEIRATAGSVHLASREMATGNQDLSHRTEMAAASLEQTASAMSELAITVQANAEAAAQADRLAAAAGGQAARCEGAVDSVAATMDDISLDTRNIASITDMIDTIAFQTNILALNAAVEAARAGEHGRGFAVVAEEVRGLARRCSDGARQIRELVNSSTRTVASGSRLAQEARRAMNDVVASVGEVSAVIEAISTSSREQSVGIGQTSQAVSLLEHATQQNAALVEESAAAAESLKDQAQRLAELVAIFEIEEPAVDAPSEAAADPAAA